MKGTPAAIATIILLGTLAPSALAQGPVLAIDRVVLKSGETVEGLIVSRNPAAVTMRTDQGEVTYRMQDIRRIQDESDDDLSYTETLKPGELPPWRVIINDIRNSDQIVRFEEIPPTRVDRGIFKNVPYKSFRGNRRLELNLYGNPDDPAGMEIGIYGPDSRDQALQILCRQFIATYLSSREEVGGLYDIPLSGGEAELGPTVISVTSPDEEDSYGAWWVSIYNKRKLLASKVSDSRYEDITYLDEQVRNPDGSLVDDPWSQNENASNIPALLTIGMGENKMYLRGFYRDENGKFHLLDVSSQDPFEPGNQPDQ